MSRVQRAVISVSNKDGIVDFARGLNGMGVEIISTGGTASLLKKSGIETTGISEVTGFPEMLDGRVKTLHPLIFAGLLARRDSAEHMSQLKSMKIKPIDMVVVNLYPFKQTVLNNPEDMDEIIENIDIGGPSMIRAAAKNYESVAVVTDPCSYQGVLDELKVNEGTLSLHTRKRLMVEAYRTTANYDCMISNFLGKKMTDDIFPSTLNIGMEKAFDLRYGENPEQTAAFYTDPFSEGASVTNAEKLHGKELSYNNILDLESAMDLAREFSRPTAVVIKHTNPCGIASADSLADAFVTAYNVDSLAAYGCVIGLNRNVDMATAEQIGSHFVDCVIAPDYDLDALEHLRKKKNIRLLRTNVPITIDANPEVKMKKVKGGILVQTNKYIDVNASMLKCVTKRQPTQEEVDAMLFAWKVCKHVWSNAIILAKGERVVGIGAGQMSRVDSSMIAAHKAKENAKGAVMASDAFFPFRDGVDEAARAGVTAIIQPGGSVRDAEVIQAADEHGMAMVFTGVRVFRH
ncbi:MAG: bifunctional phosphoribosylaminoimidazolecarboxamide formyltransferase/IMP cyclohydrolase [Methanomassiliicoccales archaeon PtaU1.Bin124]|nr:MAG: bifunctional phosphoribosylaminoimidazolecarboxamide formyltransferase/IMP cyclohydrolase [Methanomassiliicoccales archaeon PtaU1.Bin124]